MGSGVGKKLGSVLERIEGVEQTLPAMANAIQQVVNQLTARLDNLDRVVMALVEITGKDTVGSTVQAMMTAEAQEAAAKAQANLAQAVAEGKAVAMSVVTKDALVVGQEADANGTLIVPGRIQMAFENFKPELQEQLLGKGVGDVVNTSNGGTFTIQEIYVVGDLETVPGPVAAQQVVPELPAAGPVDEATTAQNEASAN